MALYSILQPFIHAKQAHENLHPTAPRNAASHALEQCLVDMARRYQDPNVPPFDPSALVHAYNGLLGNPADHFCIGTAECAMEFLSCPGLRGEGLINNLQFAAGFLTDYDQVGFCPQCQSQQHLVIYLTLAFLIFHLHLYFFQPYLEPLLHIRLPSADLPVDLRALVPIALAAPLHAACTRQDCGRPLQQARLQIALGRVLILNMARLGDQGPVSILVI